MGKSIALRLVLLVSAFAAGVAGCGDDSGGQGGSAGNTGGAGGSSAESPCSVAAAAALRTCMGSVNAAWSACYNDTNDGCDASNADVVAALGSLQTSVEAECSDGDFGLLSVSALVGRLQNSCSSESSALATRTFGGPQGAVWDASDSTAQGCLLAAHAAATTLIDDAFSSINACLANGNCDPNAVGPGEQALANTAAMEIEGACEDLASLIAIDPATYAARALQQVDCGLAASHEDPSGIGLDCGPTNAVADPPRGEYMQIVLDGEKWGTKCGDGSDYAFQIRLAPEGERLDRVIIGLQGGGVCFFEEDCTARFMNENSRTLFMSTDDDPPTTGIMANETENSPFANWTKVYLPYCNQDVFTGGGTTQEYDAFTHHRFGSINLRSAIQAARDIIWKMMDEAGGDGFRPDEIIALFGGWSAGGYGTLYNYHWLLDDLQWPRTAAFPDAGLALDNTTLTSVRTLGFALIPVWGALPYLPPYCFSGDCAVGPDNYMAISPRLKQVPEQQYLILTNQKDLIQQGDAFFDDEAFWINSIRQSYCDTKDLNGIHYYITSESTESIHVVSLRPEFYTGEVAGVTMRDWFEGAVTDPDSVPDIAEEGDFMTAVPGVNAFPCELAP